MATKTVAGLNTPAHPPSQGRADVRKPAAEPVVATAATPLPPIFDSIRDAALIAQATLGGASLLVDQVQDDAAAQAFSLLAAVRACLEKIGGELGSIVECIDIAERGES